MLKFDYGKRLKRLQAVLEAKRIDLLVLGTRECFNSNVFYYSGEESFPSLLFVTPDSARLYSLSRPKSRALDVVEFELLNNFRKQFKQALNEARANVVAVDTGSDLAAPVTFDLIKRRKRVKPFGRNLFELRLVKDRIEANCLKRAQALSKKTVAEVLEKDLAGRSENAVAGMLEKTARDLGVALNAFPPIVLSGERAANPHGVPTSEKISRDKVLLFDVGVRFNYYCGDYSKTVYSGRGEQHDAVEAVQLALREAMRKAKPGVTGRILSKLAAGVLKEKGFGDNAFNKVGLSLGHFIGLDGHESLSLEKTTLRKGMAFTIEPGVYKQGTGGFGVRFEEMVVL
ncbi:aminopeptidase P family protein [Candidatus Micrarchaeota archaeon]|nr:aminopeptidase P family protein [Candidatus Micrarchaeota archaeon]